MKKRMFGILLSLCVIMSFSPYTRAAEIVASGNCGYDDVYGDEADNVMWTLDSEGILTISGTGIMMDFYNSAPWHSKYVVKAIINDGVENIGFGAFYECADLQSVIMPNTVTKIGDSAFNYCSSLTDIKLSNNITEIEGYAFGFCAFSDIELPEGLVDISDHAFMDGKLRSVTIPSSVTHIGDFAFTGNSKLEITVDEDNKNYSSLDGTLFNKDKTKLISYTLNGKNTTRGIYQVPEGVQIIGKYAFTNSTNLRGVTLSESLTTIESEAFASANLVDDLFIPKNVSSIADGALSVCGVKNFVVDENNADYMSLDGVLFNKDKTELIVYPNQKKDTSYSIPDGVLSVKANAFDHALYIKNIVMPDSVLSIGKYAFFACRDLFEIRLSDKLEELGDNAFAYCNMLETVTIPKNVTVINERLFGDCSNLKCVALSFNVTNINEKAFQFCDSLTDVYYGGTEKDWENIKIKEGANDELLTVAIHYNTPSIPMPEILDTTTVFQENGEYVFNVDYVVPYNCQLITTLYDNGAMTGIEVNAVTSANTQKTVHISSGNATAAKIFIWDSVNGMSSLCKAKTISIE